MLILSKDSSSDFNIGYIGKDIENYSENRKKKLFEERDAQRLYVYFPNQQCKKSDLYTRCKLMRTAVWEVIFGQMQYLGLHTNTLEMLSHLMQHTSYIFIKCHLCYFLE